MLWFQRQAFSLCPVVNFSFFYLPSYNFRRAPSQLLIADLNSGKEGSAAKLGPITGAPEWRAAGPCWKVRLLWLPFSLMQNVTWWGQLYWHFPAVLFFLKGPLEKPISSRSYIFLAEFYVKVEWLKLSIAKRLGCLKTVSIRPGWFSLENEAGLPPCKSDKTWGLMNLLSSLLSFLTLALRKVVNAREIVV